MQATAKALPAFPHCSVCKVEGELLCCSGCWVVHYCTVAHQTEDWTAHQAVCTQISTTRGRLDRRTAALQSRTPNPFATLIGRFWTDRSTHDYLRARAAYINAISQVKFRAALQTAVDHSLATLRLCHTDELKIRSLVPALLLRLDQVQQAFDFLTWWHDRESGDPDGESYVPVTDLETIPSSEFLDLHDANVREVRDDQWQADWEDLTHVVCMCLLKVRLLVELHTLERIKKVKSRLPGEVMDRIRMFTISSVPWAQREEILLDEKKSQSHVWLYIHELDEALDLLFWNVERRNEHFWDALAEPEGHLEVRVEEGSEHGSEEEMQRAVQHTHRAWVETPGAMAWLRQRV